VDAENSHNQLFYAIGSVQVKHDYRSIVKVIVDAALVCLVWQGIQTEDQMADDGRKKKT
jgi:hypothetical protein